MHAMCAYVHLVWVGMRALCVFMCATCAFSAEYVYVCHVCACVPCVPSVLSVCMRALRPEWEEGEGQRQEGDVEELLDNDIGAFRQQLIQEVSMMGMAELTESLRDRGQSVVGSKNELVARMAECVERYVWGGGGGQEVFVARMAECVMCVWGGPGGVCGTHGRLR